MDIAKIGIAVEASGVAEAQQKLQQLGATGRTTGGQLLYLADAGGGASSKLGETGKSSGALHGQLRPLHGTLTSVVEQMGDLGPGASAAATGITSLAGSMTPIGLAAVAVAATFGFLISKFKEYQEIQKELKELDDASDAAFIKRKHSIAAIGAELQKEIRINQALDPEIEAINIKYDEQKQKLQDLGASYEKLQSVEIARGGATAKLQNQRQDSIAKEQLSIQNAIQAQEFEIAALGKTGQAASDAARAIRHNAIETQFAGATYSALRPQLHALADEFFNLSDSLRQINVGKQGIADFESNFGVKFTFNKEQAERNLADNFVEVFNRLKDDPREKAALQQAFSTLVGQLSDLGTQNQVGLLKSLGLSSEDFIALRDSLKPVTTGVQEIDREFVSFERNVFGGSRKIVSTITELVPVTRDLRAELDKGSLSTKDWGGTFSAAAKKMIEDQKAIGAGMERFTATVDASIIEVAALEDQLAAIPEVTHKSLIIDVFYAQSPPRPFSEFMPMMRRTFDQLEKMTAAAPDIVMRVEKPGADGVTRAAAAGRSGGGGGDQPIHIDLRGATVTHEVLERKIMPALEKIVRRTTGKRSMFRVTA